MEKALIKDQTRLDESEDETEGEREDILDLILSGMFVRFPELVKRREEKRRVMAFIATTNQVSLAKCTPAAFSKKYNSLISNLEMFQKMN